jgi:DNA primase
MFEVIREIVENSIGTPRRDSDGWREYCCPYCALEKGVESDGKYNLAVNYGEDMKTKPFFHCWRCGTSGKLSKLIKDFGNSDDLSRYYNELKNIKSSLLYQFDFDGNLDGFQIENTIELPKDFRKIPTDTNIVDKYAKDAIEYLRKRNIGKYFIEYYNIGYVPYWSKDKEMSSRIIIPSYDEYGELNYYIARDYTGKRKFRKYNNPDIKKTMFVFNEDKINWYEDVTLVEGAFDHMVVPNSIPLLGKTLKRDYATFNAVVNKAKANVNVLLDDDALNDAKKIYKLLSSTNLKGRVRLIVCPDGYDASDIYQKFGKRGIKKLMRSAKELDEFELVSIAV